MVHKAGNTAFQRFGGVRMLPNPQDVYKRPYNAKQGLLRFRYDSALPLSPFALGFLQLQLGQKLLLPLLQHLTDWHDCVEQIAIADAAIFPAHTGTLRLNEAFVWDQTCFCTVFRVMLTAAPMVA